jgi:hypothetical protein
MAEVMRTKKRSGGEGHAVAEDNIKQPGVCSSKSSSRYSHSRATQWKEKDTVAARNAQMTTSPPFG